MIVRQASPFGNDSSTCIVHQGDRITLVACSDGYQLYETQELAVSPIGLINYGENRKAIAINKSLATGKAGHLTYVIEEDNKVISASWNEEMKTIVKETLVTLNLESTEEITDLFVFDNMVVA